MVEPGKAMHPIPSVGHLREMRRELMARVSDGEEARRTLAVVELLLEQINIGDLCGRMANVWTPQDYGRADERRSAPDAASDGSEEQSPNPAPPLVAQASDVLQAAGPALELDRAARQDRTKCILRYVYQRAQHADDDEVKRALFELASDIEVYCETPSELPGPGDMLREDNPASGAAPAGRPLAAAEEPSGSTECGSIFPRPDSGAAPLVQQPTVAALMTAIAVALDVIRCTYVAKADLDRFAPHRRVLEDFDFGRLGMPSTDKDRETLIAIGKVIERRYTEELGPEGALYIIRGLLPAQTQQPGGER